MIFGRKNRLRELEIRVATIESDIERIDNVINALVTILKKNKIVPENYDEESEDTVIIEDETSNAERVVNEYVKETYQEREKLEIKRRKRGDDRKYVA